MQPVALFSSLSLKGQRILADANTGKHAQTPLHAADNPRVNARIFLMNQPR